MPHNRAVLIFVSGPQKGERLSLPGGVLLAGRSAQAHILLAEEFISREQFRFQFTHDGWIVENIGTSKVQINGKRFKRNQRILLDTGDVLSAGVVTEVLFVAPGEDPTQALDDYLDHADREPRHAEVLAAEVIADDGLVRAGESPTTSLEEVADGDGDDDDLTDEEREEQARKKKLRRYLTYGIVYGCVIIGFVVVVKWLRPPEETAKRIPFLSKDRIEEILLKKYDRTPMEKAAVEERDKARHLYKSRRNEPGILYKCVRKYKLAEAYSRKQAPVLTAQDELDFSRAKRDLLELVWDTYNNATIDLRAKNYRSAEDGFERVLRIVPAKDLPDPEQHNPLWENCIRQITDLRARTGKQKGTRKSPF